MGKRAQSGPGRPDCRGDFELQAIEGRDEVADGSFRLKLPLCNAADWWSCSAFDHFIPPFAARAAVRS